MKKGEYPGVPNVHYNTCTQQTLRFLNLLLSKHRINSEKLFIAEYILKITKMVSFLAKKDDQKCNLLARGEQKTEHKIKKYF